MASGVEELLDMLFEMVDEAKNMPPFQRQVRAGAGPRPGSDR